MICKEGLFGAHIAERCISAPLGGLRWQSGKGQCGEAGVVDCSEVQSEPRAVLARQTCEVTSEARSFEQSEKTPSRKARARVLFDNAACYCDTMSLMTSGVSSVWFYLAFTPQQLSCLAPRFLSRRAAKPSAAPRLNQHRQGKAYHDAQQQNGRPGQKQSQHKPQQKCQAQCADAERAVSAAHAAIPPSLCAVT